MILKIQKNHISFLKQSKVLSSDYFFFATVFEASELLWYTNIVIPMKTSIVFLWGGFLWTVTLFDDKMIILLGHTGNIFCKNDTVLIWEWQELDKTQLFSPNLIFSAAFLCPKRNPISFACLMCPNGAQTFFRVGMSEPLQDTHQDPSSACSRMHCWSFWHPGAKVVFILLLLIEMRWNVDISAD